MAPNCGDAEAVGDEGSIREAGITGRVGAGNVVVAEGGVLIDEHTAGQVAGQADAGRGLCVRRCIDRGVVGRIDRGGDRAFLGSKRRGAFDGGGNVPGGDDEADRTEPFLMM